TTDFPLHKARKRKRTTAARHTPDCCYNRIPETSRTRRSKRCADTMTTAVPRHVDTPQNIEERIAALSESINDFFESLDQATTITELIARYSLQRTQWHLLIDPTAEQVPTYSSLLISARAG